MGSGKSTTGKKLASKLGYSFIDLDVFLEKQSGTSISELFKKGGEELFRASENKALSEVIDLQGDHVISTGGGTPC